jgi:amino acid transporter
MMIAYVFCLPPIEELLAGAAKYKFAYIYVFVRGTGSVAGAATMILIKWFLGVCAQVGLLAATSRQMWSFARDNALPYSAQIKKVVISSLYKQRPGN